MPTTTEWYVRVWSMPYRLYGYLKATISRSTSSSLRDVLPLDIEAWNSSRHRETYNQIWASLGTLFKQEGFTLWNRRSDHLNQHIKNPPAVSNYYFESLTTNISSDSTMRWAPAVGIQHAVRSHDNKDYVVRVMSISGSGDKGLGILRRLSSTYPDILLSNNHVLPLMKEIFYEDVAFGIFPKLRGDLDDAILPAIQKVSVEDVIYMLMQALEGIAYIHDKNIAHRDLFLENFLVEWFPESLLKQTYTRPRVYLIDFETAVDFPNDYISSERLSTDLPFPDAVYKRPRPSELTETPLSYCPFRLDMWQFGFHLIEKFTSTGIPEIDTLWPTLMAEVPDARPTARQVLETLGKFVRATPPQNLQIPFDYVSIPR